MEKSLEESSSFKRQIRWAVIVLAVVEFIVIVFAVFHVTKK